MTNVNLKLLNSGYVDAFIYVIVSSVSFVCADKLIAGIGVINAMCIMSFVAIVSFNVLNARNILPTYKACFTHKATFLLMSGALALDWVGMIFATYQGDPFIADSGLFICLAIVGFIKIYSKTKNNINLFSVMLLLAALLTMDIGYQVRAGSNTNLGMLWGLFAGVTFYIYLASSEHFAELSNLSSLSVMSTRFWLLFVSMLPFASLEKIQFILTHRFYGIMAISLGMTVISVYFNQQAIKKLGAAKTSIVIALVPPVVYVVYLLMGQELKLNNAIVCTMITIALVLPKIVHKVKS